jgi:hypothetical protein
MWRADAAGWGLLIFSSERQEFYKKILLDIYHLKSSNFKKYAAYNFNQSQTL